jgi:hypothetical protein
VLWLASGLGLARLPIGAPAAAIAIEELSARGMETVHWRRHCRRNRRSADRRRSRCLLRWAAGRRDIHHYAQPEPFALPDPGLAAQLRAALPAAAYGPSRTTDAPYRETVEEMARSSP